MSDIVDVLVDGMADAQYRSREHGRDGRHARMRAQVLARVAAPVAPSRPSWVWPAAVGAVAIAVMVAWLDMRPRPLTFEVYPGGTLDGAQAFVAATDDAPTLLRFSDGSAVELRATTRMRVTSVNAGETVAELALDAGALEIRLAPDGAGTWSIVAGPYHIKLTGAALEVAWDPETGRFALELARGTAHVSGPGIDGIDDVAVGERLVIMRRDEPEVVASKPVPDEPPPIAMQPAEAPVSRDDGPPLPRREEARRRPAAATPHPATTPRVDGVDDWRALARKGDHAGAFAAAEAVGFDRLYTTLDATALLELADVARYAGRTKRAREALEALRLRFAGTTAAATAAFDLGRLAGSRDASCSEATRWFRTYLSERPAGAMAKAARARIDECAAREPAASP